MTAIAALPPAPLPTDSVPVFNAKTFALVGALPDFVDQTNAQAVLVNADAIAAAGSAADAAADRGDAYAAAAAAAGNAVAAASSAGAAMWASGTYAAGAAVRSPSTLRIYINRTTGSRTTDPALDPANWAFPAGYLTVVPRAGTAHTVTANERSNFTNPAAVAVTLPTVLAVGDEWAGHFDNARIDNTFDLGSNSLKHNGVTRSGAITCNQLGPVNLIWGGDFWRFK